MFEMCLTSLDLFENVLETSWNVVSNLLAICPTFTWNWFETCFQICFQTCLKIVPESKLLRRYGCIVIIAISYS